MTLAMRATTMRCTSAPLLRRPGVALLRAPDQRRHHRRAPPAPRAADDSAGTSSSGGKGEAESSFEDLFAQELKRRGIDEAAAKAGGKPSSSSTAPRGQPAANPFAAGAPSSAPPRSGPRDETQQQRSASSNSAESAESDGQRERSMRLVSEGLDGLLPRARELLLLGGSVFLGFLPAMLIFSLVFTGIFSVFGDSFVHGGRQGALPTYVDPEQLLAAPTVDRFVPFRPDDGF